MADVLLDPPDDLANLAVRLARSGGADRASAQRLCELLAPRLRLFLLRREKDAALAHDLAQEAMITVLDALASGRVDQPERVTSFALTVCRSIGISEARKRARRERLLAQVVEETCAEMPALLRVELPRVGECFNKLPFRERQTMFETFMLERDANAIAATLDTTAGNVRVLRHRAIALLRRCLGVEVSS